MNKFLYIIMFAITLGFSSCEYVHELKFRDALSKGNNALENGNYEEAKQHYTKAQQLKQNDYRAIYNNGIANYYSRSSDSAILDLELALSATTDSIVPTKITHNTGNVHLDIVRQLTDSTQQQNDSTAAKVKESLTKALEQYKLAINHNYKNDSAQYNYIYTLNLLKQQEQNQDQKKDDKKDDKKEEQDKKEDNNKDNKENKPDEKERDNKQPQNSKMNKNQALQDLKALENREKKLLEKLNLKKEQGTPVKTDKDW